MAGLLLLALTLTLAACAPSGSWTGDPAPAIAGTTLDGAAFDLRDLRGRPVVINFWASWCTPCRDEFPVLQARLDELGPTDGLAIVGVLYKDDAGSARRFQADMGAAWPTIVDPEGRLADAYRVVAPPQTYFVDIDGIIRGVQIGEIRESDFATQYAKIAP